MYSGEITGDKRNCNHAFWNHGDGTFELPFIAACKLEKDPQITIVYVVSGASFQLFLGGANFFFIFQCHRTNEKLEKTALYCSNSTLFIVPFYLSFFFLLFFSFFFLFFLFSFSLGGGGGDGLTAPSPPQMTPLRRIVGEQNTWC